MIELLVEVLLEVSMFWRVDVKGKIDVGAGRKGVPFIINKKCICT